VNGVHFVPDNINILFGNKDMRTRKQHALPVNLTGLVIDHINIQIHLDLLGDNIIPQTTQVYMREGVRGLLLSLPFIIFSGSMLSPNPNEHAEREEEPAT